MADIIPFPSQNLAGPDDEQAGGIPLLRAGEGLPCGLGKKSGKLEQMIKEIAELYEDPSAVECAHCRFDLKEDESEQSLEIDFASLDELVVFSPEIQKDGFKLPEPAGGLPGTVRWGDVFVKSGDVYPFLFTVYTEDYVNHQLVSYGEKILPSPKDIILRREQLSPQDIIRAVIKWANLYSPQHRGKPVRLENDTVLKDLVCEPGIEVVVAERS